MTMSVHTFLSLSLDGHALLGSADASTSQDAGGSFLFTLLFMGAIGGAMYFLMIRPQRRRMRESQELQRAIEVGDEIITNSGMYGFVNAIDGDVVWLEIAENTEIRIARNAMLRRINPVVEPAGGEPKPADELEGE